MEPKRKQNRSSEELEMRELIVPRLRQKWPAARIIHELPLRYSTRRIDLAAVTETEIIAIEIKSSKDVMDRLEGQIRGFIPISSRVIVALAPKWNQKLELIEFENPKFKGSLCWREQFTPTQELLRNIGLYNLEIWTVDASAKTINITNPCYGKPYPWGSKMLELLHVSELTEIAGRHRICTPKRPNHLTLVMQCADHMSGLEIKKAVCAALRRRPAFGGSSDPPI